MNSFSMLYIDFDINDTESVVTQLRYGNSQFAILDTDKVTRDMQCKILAPEEFLLVCSSQWKGRKLLDIIKSERIIDFNEADKTTLNYLKTYNLLNYAQTDRLFVNRNEPLCKMILEGFGYGTLTKEVASTYIVTPQKPRP